MLYEVITRAAVLGGVHLLIAVHVTHYLIAGRTLSPVEPSESMYTLEPDAPVPGGSLDVQRPSYNFV